MERNEEVNEFGISKQLEAKIEMALENGPLNENDLAYFRNCAQKDGVSDVDLNFYINQLSKIIGKKQSESIADAQAQYIQKQRDAIGNECPKCHEQIPPMSLECPYCHTKVVNKKANSSITELAEKIDNIRSTTKDAAEKEVRIAETINLFPVPNTKEDILEFLALATPNAKKKGGVFGTRGGRFAIFSIINLIFAIVIYIQQGMIYGFDDKELLSITIFAFFTPFVVIVLPLSFVNWGQETLAWNRTAKVWYAKYEQVILKARSIKGDSDFQQQLDYYESKLK